MHYWADLQSVHGFRCYDNIVPNAKCQRVLVLALCLVSVGVVSLATVDAMDHTQVGSHSLGDENHSRRLFTLGLTRRGGTNLAVSVLEVWMQRIVGAL